jgi:hypothetical protein
VAALEARLARKRPVRNGRFVPRMTRLDRCPYGWRPNPKNPAELVPHWNEQEVIRHMFDAHKQKGLSGRALCRYLDASGFRRRGLKKWVGAHGIVRAILARPMQENGLY